MISKDQRLLTIGHSAVIRVKLLSLLARAIEPTGQRCDKTCKRSPEHLCVSSEYRRDGKLCHASTFQPCSNQHPATYSAGPSSRRKDIDLQKMILDIKDNDTQITELHQHMEEFLHQQIKGANNVKRGSLRFIRRLYCSVIYESPQMAVMQYNIHKYDAMKIIKASSSAIFSFGYKQNISGHSALHRRYTDPPDF